MRFLRVINILSLWQKECFPVTSREANLYFRPGLRFGSINPFANQVGCGNGFFSENGNKVKVDEMAEAKVKGKIKIDRERCKGCLLCIEVCPNDRIAVDETQNKKGYNPAKFVEEVKENEKGCVGCAQCATVCPEVAIEVYRAK